MVKKLHQDHGLSGVGSKQDNIQALKARLGAPPEFVKVFSKMWGGSGKFLLRQHHHTLQMLIYFKLISFVAQKTKQKECFIV